MDTKIENRKEKKKEDSVSPAVVAEFKAFANEFRSESDRAAVILGAAKLDLLLFQILQRAFKPVPSRDELLEGDCPIGTFSARIAVTHRLGLIDSDFARALNLVRKIRNSFAHELSGVSLNAGAHRDRIRELTSSFEGHGCFKWLLSSFFPDESSASEFRAAVALMCLRLEGLFGDRNVPLFRKTSMTLLPPSWNFDESGKELPPKEKNARKTGVLARVKEPKES